VQIYIARLQKFSDVLTAENKNVFSFAAKVQTVQFNIRSSGGRLFHTLQSSRRRWQYESVERTGFWCRRTAADVDQPHTSYGPVCVCTSRSSTKMAKQIELVFGMEVVTCPALCVLRNSFENKGSFFQTLNLSPSGEGSGLMSPHHKFFFDFWSQNGAFCGL